MVSTFSAMVARRPIRRRLLADSKQFGDEQERVRRYFRPGLALARPVFVSPDETANPKDPRARTQKACSR